MVPSLSALVRLPQKKGKKDTSVIRGGEKVWKRENNTEKRVAKRGVMSWTRSKEAVMDDKKIWKMRRWRWC